MKKKIKKKKKKNEDEEDNDEEDEENEEENEDKEDVENQENEDENQEDEYIICTCYPKYKNHEKINRTDTFNEFLIKKYKNKLTPKFNKKDILNINFEKIEIDIGRYYYHNDLYITNNKRFIQFIRKIEKHNFELENPYIFIRFENKFKKYITFNVADIININDDYKLTYNIRFTNEYLDQLLYEDGAYDEVPFVYASININKYYKDLITNNKNNDTIKSNIINDIHKILKFDFNVKE